MKKVSVVAAVAAWMAFGAETVSPGSEGEWTAVTVRPQETDEAGARTFPEKSIL